MTIDEPHSLEEEQEKKQPWEFVKWIFRVLYSPMKTFEEIVEKPNIKGPVLILLITLPLILGGQYISGTKFFLETPTPENDLWTESVGNSTSFLWNSNDNVTLDSYDCIVGNYSVSSSLTNSSLIWMRLTNIGSFNCSKEEYSCLSFRIKWINEADDVPTAILQLFSFNNESKKIELDIGGIIANNTSVWANISVNLATDNWIGASEKSASWTNITGISFLLIWSNTANLVLKIDDLFFGKYTPISSSNTFDLQLTYSFIRGGINFLVEWLILFGIVLLALRSFSDWNGIWKNLLFILGYVYSASIIYLGALALLFILLPPIFLPYNTTYLEYLDIYQGSWGTPITFLSLFAYGWTTILCAIALKKIHELSWNKAFLIGLGAVVMSLLFSSFLLNVLL